MPPREGRRGKVEHEHEDDDENDRKGVAETRSGTLAELAKRT